MTERVLLGDVGGTNARFAVLSDGALGPIEHLAVARYAQALSDALSAAGAESSVTITGPAVPRAGTRTIAHVLATSPPPDAAP